MNILLLAAGSGLLDARESHHLLLREIDGIPLVERLAVTLRRLGGKDRVIVALRHDEARKYHLAEVVGLTFPAATTVLVPGETGGAACTALLAADLIDDAEELLILSANEVVDVDLDRILSELRASKADAGTLTFDSVHPRYSFVRLDEQGWVVEASEKRPISRHATAGLYWFRHGADFVAAAKSMIRKDARQEGRFYICPALNELILRGKKVAAHPIDARQYHPLKSDRQVDEASRHWGRPMDEK